MIEAMLEGLLHLTPNTLLWMLFGIVFTTVIAIIPGLGGVFAMAMMLPLVYTLEPNAGLAMLVAAVAVEGTGNTITSVLFGVPGSATGVATVLDGYPMAKRGEGTRAVAAGLTASAVGGLIGAAALMAVLPFMRPIVLALSSPEFFMLILAALVFMAFVGQTDKLKSLIAGFVGLMLSFVGMEISTGTTRYVFSQVYLWDGIQLIPMMIGLFALAEMMVLLRSGGTIARDAMPTGAWTQMRQGMADVFRKARITLQSSVTGIIVGVAPGVGGAAAQFLAYTQALKTSRRGKYYGTGEVEGVIAADAATNSKDGGSLVPALAFGIPGSASTAILIAAMIGRGIQPGEEMLTTNLSVTWMFIWVLVIANLIAAALSLIGSGVLAKVTRVRVTGLAPVILVVSLFGAYADSGQIGDVWTAIAFGAVGYAMVRFGYSRATFVIGFVLGILLERHYLLSMRLYGLEFIQRPVVLAILVLVLLVVMAPVAAKLIKTLRKPGATEADRDANERATRKTDVPE